MIHSFDIQGILKPENSNNSINKSLGDRYKLNKNSEEHSGKKNCVSEPLTF